MRQAITRASRFPSLRACMPRIALKTDPKGRILGALQTHAWLPIIALHAGMRPEEAFYWLGVLWSEGRARRYKPELWGRG